MSIVKFKIKNSISSTNNTNIKNNAINLKMIEKRFIFFSKLELTSILNHEGVHSKLSALILPTLSCL